MSVMKALTWQVAALTFYIMLTFHGMQAWTR